MSSRNLSLALSLTLLGGCRQVPAEVGSATPSTPSSGSEAGDANDGASLAAREAKPPLVVDGLRERDGRIEIVSHSPDSSWRLSNRRSPCDDCVASLGTSPTHAVYTTLRCEREDGRRVVIASSYRGLDSRYDARTDIGAKPRPERCELSVTVRDRARDVDDTTQFCWLPGTPIADAKARACEFAEVETPPALMLSVREASVRDDSGSMLSASPPRLSVQLDAIHGPTTPASELRAEAFCFADGQRWSGNTKERIADGGPGEVTQLTLRFEVRGDPITIESCHLLLVEHLDDSDQTRDHGVFCLERLPVDPLGQGLSAVDKPFSARPGTCDG